MPVFRRLISPLRVLSVLIVVGLLFVGFAKANSTPDDVTAIQKLAEQGDAQAQNNLGFMYANGTGVAEDYKAAVYWFTKAAEQGMAEAQLNLGHCYSQGMGVAKNNEQSLFWYNKAAQQGNPLAQHNLGFIYYSGLGVAKDKKRFLLVL